jgi:anti-sigma factor RsiW
MTDRMDIDALLISALYGELTPAEEAQLTAHLESHPADRTALADLSHTRATVRESRIFSVQFDPPQSVSAMLLQEAARRAPKPSHEAAGWFHRFTRSFMMHPAMAAAAMLVLVVGVAGTLYLRHGDQMFVEPAAPREAIAQVSSREALSAASPATTPPAAGATGGTPEPAPPEGNTVAPATGAAGSDAYRVGLDEAAGRRKEAKDGEAQERMPERETQAVAKAEVPAPKPAKPVPRGSIGIEVPGHEMMPKELPVDDDRGGGYAQNNRAAATDKVDQRAVAKRAASNADADSARASATTIANAQPPPGAGAAGGGAATAAPGMIAPQNDAAAAGPAGDPGAAPAADAPRSPVTETRNDTRNYAKNDAKSKAPAKAVARSSSPQAQAPSPQPSSPPPPAAAAELSKFRADNRQQVDKPLANQANARPADVKLAEEAGEDKALIGWAQKQRDQVLALVRSNNCRAAANAALEIYNRAPDYYAANVETDRSIKPCIAYVNDMRERADRSRAAAKRVNAADAPAQAAPPPPARK